LLVPMRDEKIVARYKAGMDINQLAKEFGLTPNGLFLVLKRSGIKADRPRGRKRENREKVQQLYKAGLSPKQIAKETGISIASVYNNINYSSNKHRKE